MIVENIPLDLGLTPKEIQKFLLDKLNEQPELANSVEIVDIDMNNGPTSIAV